MQPNHLSPTTDAGPASDLGPLAWVFDEVRKSLDSANRALKRFASDVADARESDLSAADPSALRAARSQLHQVVGAMEMVGFHAAASVVRGMEAAVQRFVAKPMLCNDEAAAKVERAGFGLIEYLEATLNGKQISPVALFPQYRDVQELAAAQRIHPADLWEASARHPVLRLPQGVTVPALHPGPDVRARFDRYVLHVIKNLHPIAAAHMAQTCAGLATGSVDASQRTFWLAATAYFEAVQHGLLPPDVYVKRAASRILLQYTAQSQAKPDVSSALLHDLCFFVVLAREQTHPPTPWLNAAREALAAPSLSSLDYERQTLGKFDPALLAQARRRVDSVKEGWSLLAGGDLDKTRQVNDQLALVADSLHKILPSAEPLGRALVQVLNTHGQPARVPSTELGMEVATAILYLEALLQDIDATDATLPERMAQMAQRVERAHGGQPSLPLEHWMEALYRKVSDKQTMGSVVGELKVSLGELERDLDQFSRDPSSKQLLAAVPQKLAQMRGVLSVLGLDQAASAVAHMRANVETMLVDEIDPERAREAGTFSRLANNLSALSFLIDMLNYQPALARKLFVFDAEEGELRPVMGRTAAGPVVVEALASQPPLDIQIEQVVQSVAEAAQGGASVEDLASLTTRLDGLAQQAALADRSAVAQAAREVSTAVAAMETPEAPVVDAQALAGLAALAPNVAAPVPVPAESANEDELVEDDLIDIFLEEARDVIQAGLAATRALSGHADSLSEQTTLRRAFHTLKGSSRMVGLSTFGEAAWAMEQVMNAWLAASQPATPELCELCDDALQTLSKWVEDIAAHQAAHWQAEPFVAASLAMRERGQRLSLSAQPEAVAEPVLDMPLPVADVVPGPATETAAVPEVAVGVDEKTVCATESTADHLPEAAPDALDIMSLFADEEPLPQSTSDLQSEPAPDLPVVSDLPEASLQVEPTWAGSVDELALDAVTVPVFDEVPVSKSASESVQDSGVEPAVYPVDSTPAEIPDEPAVASVSEPVLAAGDAVAATEDDGLLAIDLDSLLNMDAEPQAAKNALQPDLPVSDDAAPDFNLDWDVPLDADVPVPSADDASLPFSAELSDREADGLPDTDALAAPATPLIEPEVVELDLADLNFDFPRETPATGGAEKGLEALAEADLDVDSPATAELVPAEDAVQEPGSIDFDLDFGDEPSPVQTDVVSDVAADVEAADQAPLPDLDVEPVVTALEVDDDTKVIGPLRIGVKLFNVYLNEADEWSRRLSHELGEWSLEHALRAVPDGSAALAHSLAGASGAVGFDALAGLARALEHALDAASGHASRNGQMATASEAELFVRASDDIRRLLHQFAAGFLKEPAPDLVQALEALVHRPQPETDSPLAGDLLSHESSSDPLDFPLDPVAPPTVSADSEAVADPEQSMSDTPDVSSGLAEQGEESEAIGSPDAEAFAADQAHAWADPSADTAKQDDSADTSEPGAVEASDAQASTSSETDLPVVAVQPAQSRVVSVDDDLDAVDTLDADLFQIFDEEAQELLPRLGAALRQWVARPENASARVEVLRNLHTVKGSARLAGALRLGEMAHRMETQADRLGSAVTDPALIEPLLASYDELVGRLDMLRLPDDVVVPHRVTTAAEVPAQMVAGDEPAPVSQQTSVQPVDGSLAAARLPVPLAQGATAAAVRVRPELLDRLVNQTGEVMITRSRMEAELGQLRGSLTDLTDNLDRLRHQLRDIELQAESQMQSRMAQTKDTHQTFDPLEFDRFTRVQELTRMMAESVNDVATVQRNLQRAVDATEDGLAAQARQTRELQRDLLRTRMVEFEGIADRLYRVVRQASKESGKQVRLDIVGGSIEMDRGVLDRMTTAFEHLLRNCVVHGIEPAEQRMALGKPAEGRITVTLAQEGNDVSVDFSDDGQGLDLPRIRAKAEALGLLSLGQTLADADIAQFIFAPGLTTATEVTGLAGRGIGMDVVRSEVVGLGGRVDTRTEAGRGTHFHMVLPLTTAVTQVVMLRAGDFAMGVPSGQVEVVRRVNQAELESAYASGSLLVAGESVPFYWTGALLQMSRHSNAAPARTYPVVIFRSAAQRVALHVDEVLGNQEVVVKNLGPQLSRLPGLAATTVLASGAVSLIYNPVALSALYGEQVRAWLAQGETPRVPGSASAKSVQPAPEEPRATAVGQAPLVLVVDDSITVRRVTQRLLVREGYRVALAADGLQALEKLQGERPAVVLSDIEMPRMDGFDLVRNIRGDARLANLPVIMITSRIADKHREHARQLGVDHYLGKPYSEDELLHWIREYCSQELDLAV